MKRGNKIFSLFYAFNSKEISLEMCWESCHYEQEILMHMLKYTYMQNG